MIIFTLLVKSSSQFIRRILTAYICSGLFDLYHKDYHRSFLLRFFDVKREKFKHIALASSEAIDKTFAASGRLSPLQWKTCSPKKFRHLMELKDPVENLPTVVVIPISARTAEFANLFVTLTIASRKFATPILDRTENQRMVDLAYMKTNIGTYTGVSQINLLLGTCNLYDLELRP